MSGSLSRLALLASLLVVPTVATVGCGPTQRPDGGEGLLPEGATAPDLSSTDHTGQRVALAQLRGQPVLVYFYPKDGTPGCTAEACAIRDTWDQFGEAQILVIGVSGDDVESHRAFAEQNDLPFPLVADTDLQWATAFGVGTLGGFMERVSFLIDAQGKVAKVYPGVDPAVHAQQVLDDVAALPSSASAGSAASPED